MTLRKSRDLDVEVDEELAAMKGGTWRRDTETGHWIAPPLQEAYLEWLLDPDRQPKSKEAWAAKAGLYDTKALYKWESNERFQSEWRRRHAESVGKPGVMQPVWDALWKTATQGSGASQVKAAEMILRQAEMMRPPEIRVIRDADIDSMSDEELMALWQGDVEPS